MRRQPRNWGEDDAPAYTVGTAACGESGEPDGDYPVAVLWLPDPDTRYGWAMRDVKRQAGKPKGRRAGFVP